MFAVEVYAAVRHFVFVEGHSRREAARVFGLSRETVLKMCRFSLPPGYTRTRPVAKPKLGPLLPVIDAILEADRTAPVKQRHTAKRIFERLRDEHGFAGGYTVVKDYVRIGRARGPRDLRAAGASAGPCAGGFRRGGRRDRRRSSEDPLLLHGPAAVGCLLREGLSGARRPRRSSTGTCRPSPSSAGCRCRSSTTTPRSRWRRSAATASASGRGPSPSWSAITCSSDRFGRPGQGQRQGQGRGAGEVSPGPTS